MNIQITNQEVKESNNMYRYYLEVTLSQDADYLWEESYQEALKREPFTSMYGSGAPVVNKISIQGNKIITNDFAEFAMNDVKEFIKELKRFITIANSIYESKQAHIKQEQAHEEHERQERNKKLEDLNKKLNS